MELTTKNVCDLFSKYNVDDQHEAIKIHILNGDLFFTKDIQNDAALIVEMLEQLPFKFRESGGGGWSFLNACRRADGYHWGEHIDMARLFALGMAVGRVKPSLPDSMIHLLPGGMPYFVFLDRGAHHVR